MREVVKKGGTALNKSGGNTCINGNNEVVPLFLLSAGVTAFRTCRFL